MRALSHKGLLAALAAGLLSGCIRDDLPSCTTLHELCIRVAAPAPGEEPPAAGADTATLFVFDGADILQEVKGVGRAVLADGAPVEIRYCASCRPMVVVWGNLVTSLVTPPVPGVTTFDQLRVGMRSVGEYDAVPDNLYYGIRNITCEPTQCVEISPAMGRLTLTARGLAREEGERYFFRVETEVDGYDFRRTPQLGKAALRLDAARRDSSGDLTSGEAVPLFAYPEQHGSLAPLQVSLYRLTDDGVRLVGRTDLDDKLQQIVPQAGRCVHVMMNFRAPAGLKVEIRITEWDVIELWEDW